MLSITCTGLTLFIVVLSFLNSSIAGYSFFKNVIEMYNDIKNINEKD